MLLVEIKTSIFSVTTWVLSATVHRSSGKWHVPPPGNVGVFSAANIVLILSSQ